MPFDDCIKIITKLEWLVHFVIQCTDAQALDAESEP